MTCYIEVPNSHCIENTVALQLLSLMFMLLDKNELETAQQFLDQAAQQNLVCCVFLLS